MFHVIISRRECFNAKYTMGVTQTKLHPGLEWHSCHILTDETSFPVLWKGIVRRVNVIVLVVPNSSTDSPEIKFISWSSARHA